MTIKSFFRKKVIIWTIVIVVVVGGIVYRIIKPGNSTSGTLTDIVKRQDLKQTVLATGQVTSGTDLDLSFRTSGIVTRVNVAVGDKVNVGDVLATLDQKDAVAGLTTAQGSLAQAQANYQKVLSGASTEEVSVAQSAVDAAQVALDNAKKNLNDTVAQQQVLVNNALRTLLNSGLAAIPATSNLNTSNPTISGAYVGTQQGAYSIRQTGNQFSFDGLEVGGPFYISAISPVSLGSRGLSIQFPTSYIQVNNDTWAVSIPNTNSSAYTTNNNAYLAALQTQNVAITTAQAQIATAQASLDQAVAQLNLKKAQARPADVAVAQAQVLSAQGQVQTAQSNFENTVIRAPASGTITSVDIKVGELATALKEAVILQDVDNLYLEANVSEANIAIIKSGQSVDVTFDALGPDEHFKAAVQTVDPASTVISGVVNYKIKASLEDASQIKPGMTANMTILAAEKRGVLAVPQRAVVNRDSEHFVRVIDDPQKKIYHQVQIQTGLNADGGLVEVTSGLREGQEIVTFLKS
jgi:HlyD family secretion protein